ncbi:hypothetical protein [Desulfocucumis palustris]|nr:hypothetical protein [Desulfocucumis palustris]
MSKFMKFLLRLCRDPIPNDITFDEMARFLKSIKCSMRKGGGSHMQFKYPGFYKTITLMEDTNIRKYQLEDIRELLDHLNMCPEENE